MPAPAGAATSSCSGRIARLSFQLSGAQVGISITTLITGYLAEPLVARLLEPVFAAIVAVRRTSRAAWRWRWRC